MKKTEKIMFVLLLMLVVCFLTFSASFVIAPMGAIVNSVLCQIGGYGMIASMLGLIVLVGIEC